MRGGQEGLREQSVDLLPDGWLFAVPAVGETWTEGLFCLIMPTGAACFVIKGTGAEVVKLTHGDGEPLVRYLNECGINGSMLEGVHLHKEEN